MAEDIQINERSRKIKFNDGEELTLTNLTLFNKGTTMLRLVAEEGYVLINPETIKYMIIDGERVD